mgnify:CR=1 FL=1
MPQALAGRIELQQADPAQAAVIGSNDCPAPAQGRIEAPQRRQRRIDLATRLQPVAQGLGVERQGALQIADAQGDQFHF